MLKKLVVFTLPASEIGFGKALFGYDYLVNLDFVPGTVYAYDSTE